METQPNSPHTEVDPSNAMEDHESMIERLMKPGADILAQLTADKCALLHMAVGLSTEAGELLDAVKRHCFYNKPLDLVNVTEESGDIEFYHGGVRYVLGFSRTSALAHNINKLEKGKNARYATGTYTDEAAQQRADKVEGGETGSSTDLLHDAKSEDQCTVLKPWPHIVVLNEYNQPDRAGTPPEFRDRPTEELVLHADFVLKFRGGTSYEVLKDAHGYCSYLGQNITAQEAVSLINRYNGVGR